MSSYQHLESKTREFVSLPTEERIKLIRSPSWVGYPRAINIIGQLEDLIQYPRQARMPNLLIVGPTNNGKTKLIEQFRKRYPIDENIEGDHIIAPVLYFQAPPTPDEGGFYEHILNSLFEQIPSGSISRKRNHVVHLLRSIGLRMLIIDELHNILAGASTKQQQFLNMIKFLSNELCVPIVGLGTGDLLKAVAIDSQIQNRFTAQLLPEWKYDRNYKILLNSFEKLIPLAEQSKLGGPEISRKIFALSEGTIGETFSLIKEAAVFAIKYGREKIDLDDLSRCAYVPPFKRTKAASILD